MRKIKYGYVYLSLGILGVMGGLTYWNFWGCTDSCPIDSSPSLSMLRGALIGLCAAAIFQPSKPKSNPKSDQDEA